MNIDRNKRTVRRLGSALPLQAMAVTICLAGLLGRTGTADAATLRVSNCQDSGAGSLRHAVFAAQDGDTIDMRALTCGVVVFARAIRIDQNGLTIVGPGASALALDGNRAGRLFFQPGPGTLSLQSITLRNGRYAAPRARGGCISSAGNIELRDAWIHHCVAFVTSTPGGWPHEASGGGVYSLGSVSLLRSRVFANSATSNLPEFSSGSGGIAASGDVTLVQSTVEDNAASTEASPREGSGGGIVTGGHLTLYRSSILRNRAHQWGGAKARLGFKATYSSIDSNEGGGIVMSGGENGPGNDFELYHSSVSRNLGRGVYAGTGGYNKTVIEDSTISGNVAPQISAAIFWGWVDVRNSTIAFNREEPGSGYGCSAAVYIEVGGTLQSSIVAANSCSSGPEYDISTGFYEGQNIYGANNIIGSSVLSVPADTLSVDPRLEPLNSNGGPTLTHALLSDSPAIDRGNNSAGLTYDQRGAGFPRVKGVQADIGAVER
jgi:hypothetical protein